jgi:hypothetical protein
MDLSGSEGTVGLEHHDRCLEHSSSTVLPYELLALPLPGVLLALNEIPDRAPVIE